ncbi:sulfur carrier protein ThiS [Bacillus sp. Marseille-P3661]|uniref:sulfur carrier protein ThiS n=1 Tax=Bacillus sp. Marseille-P3661 TaxID=1936234 RepID=UPI000C834207|nr:sulfur carrier protein ThiS [Bacillus sp. Marseille-P3661]
MQLQVNGNIVQLPNTLQYVIEVLTHYELENKPVIVELNGQIVMKESLHSTTISEGDTLEIVHFVGGG